MKTFRIVLASALLFSSIGVTVVSVACANGSKKTVATCEACKAAVHGKAKKSCCIYVAKHLSLKAEFAKAVSPEVFVPTAISPLLADFAPLRTLALPSFEATTLSPPLSAVEKCALISNFRL